VEFDCYCDELVIGVGVVVVEYLCDLVFWLFMLSLLRLVEISSMVRFVVWVCWMWF